MCTLYIYPGIPYRVNQEDLPSVDAAVEPCIQELLESVAVLKTQPGAVKFIPVNEFPFDLGTLERSFSAIFQASHRCREKTKQGQGMLSEAAWRHDHDRLLFDFFIRLIQPTTGGATHTLVGGHSIIPLEDPLSRPMYVSGNAPGYPFLDAFEV